MKILVVSDTHGRFSRLQDLIARIGTPDMLIHCGDVEGEPDYIRQIAGCETHIVRGNCDFTKELPKEEIVEANGHRIFVTHGHLYRVRYGVDELKEAAREQKCDIALFGHTHEPYLGHEDDIYIANPGSISEPRQGDGRPTYMTIEFDQHGTPVFYPVKL